jgi:hypothetical protein
MRARRLGGFVAACACLVSGVCPVEEWRRASLRQGGRQTVLGSLSQPADVLEVQPRGGRPRE